MCCCNPGPGFTSGENLKRDKKNTQTIFSQYNQLVSQSSVMTHSISILLICLLMPLLILCASKNKPHGHKGILEAFDGKPLPLNLSPEEDKKLNCGETVSFVALKVY